jgi:hypothetical protein
MQQHTRRPVTGAAGIALAAALMGSLGACGDDETRAAGSDGAEGAVATPAAADCTPVTYNREEAEEGCWSLLVPGVDAPRLELDLPEGFSVGGPYAWWHPAGGEWEGNLALSQAGDVHPDPCLRRDDPPDSGSTVEDFIAALDAQLVTEMTAPEPVSVGGHDGQYVELSVPATFSFAPCRGQELNLWQSPSGDTPTLDREVRGPLRIWVLDAEGKRLAISVNLPSDATPAMVARFADVVADARFSPGG